MLSKCAFLDSGINHTGTGPFAVACGYLSSTVPNDQPFHKCNKFGVTNTIV